MEEFAVLEKLLLELEFVRAVNAFTELLLPRRDGSLANLSEVSS
jgi:hypothetical protein